MSIKDYLKPYIRPTLEAAGGTLGGIAATPANIVAPGIAEALGIGLGTTGGAKLDDIIEDYLYDKPVEPLSKSLPETAKDVAYNSLAGTLPTVLSGIKNGVVKPIVKGTWKHILGQSEDLPEMMVRPTPEYTANVKGGLDKAGGLNRSDELYSKWKSKYDNTMVSKTPIYEQAASEGKKAPQDVMQKVMDYIEKKKTGIPITPDEERDVSDLLTTAKRASIGDSSVPLQKGSDSRITFDNLSPDAQKRLLESGQQLEGMPTNPDNNTEVTPQQVDAFKKSLYTYKAKTPLVTDMVHGARNYIIDPEMEKVYGPEWTKANQNMGTAQGIADEGKFRPTNKPYAEDISLEARNNASIPKSTEISAPKLNEKDTYFDLSNKDLGKNDLDAVTQAGDATDYQNLPDDIKAQFLAKQRLGSKATAGFGQRIMGKTVASEVLTPSQAVLAGVLGTSQKLLNTGVENAGNIYRPAYSALKNIPLGAMSSSARQGIEDEGNEVDDNFRPVKDLNFRPVE